MSGNTFTLEGEVTFSPESIKLVSQPYQQLLSSLPEEWLDAHISIYLPSSGEYFQAALTFETGDDVLDNGHPYLRVIK